MVLKFVLAFFCATLPVLSHAETARDAAQRNYGIAGISSLGAGKIAVTLGYARVFREKIAYETKLDQTMPILINLDKEERIAQEPSSAELADLFERAKKHGRGNTLVQIKNSHAQPIHLKMTGPAYVNKKVALRGFSLSLENRDTVDLAKHTAGLIKMMWDFSEKPCRPQNKPMTYIRVKVLSHKIIPNRWNSFLAGLGASSMAFGVMCLALAVAAGTWKNRN